MAHKKDKRYKSNGRTVFKPHKAKCHKCGSPIAFYLMDSGKWCVCELNGDDHWDPCSHNRMHGVYGIKIEIVTERFIGVTKPNHKRPLYNGEEPPWGL